jgi:predicted HTH domain antitoxin
VSITVTAVVRDGALSALRRNAIDFAAELKRPAVVKWYEMGTISQGQGAEILGVSRSEFLEVLSDYRVSPFQNEEDDLPGLGREP